MKGWIYFDENKSDTYPPEGENVIVSDNESNLDIAWYLMSSEYTWQKHSVIKDESSLFIDFIPIKWKHIN